MSSPKSGNATVPTDLGSVSSCRVYDLSKFNELIVWRDRPQDEFLVGRFLQLSTPTSEGSILSRGYENIARAPAIGPANDFDFGVVSFFVGWNV